MKSNFGAWANESADLIHNTPRPWQAWENKYCYRIKSTPLMNVLFVYWVPHKSVYNQEYISLNYIKQLRLKDDIPLALHQTL